jgi:hypothetical protein
LRQNADKAETSDCRLGICTQLRQNVLSGLAQAGYHVFFDGCAGSPFAYANKATATKLSLQLQTNRYCSFTKNLLKYHRKNLSKQ